MDNGIISLTFDDGYVSQFERALPILDRYDIKATFYIITSNIRATGPVYFGCDKILALTAQGHEIGAHTVSHPNLASTFLWKGREIRLSKEDLASIGIQATSFAYPYGRHNKLVRWLVKRSGFDNARAADDRFSRRDRWRIASMSITNTTTIDDVRAWIHAAQEKKYFLVLVFHEIEENPSMWGCTPSLLNEICRLLASTGLPLTTISDGWKMSGK
jgi:peptidoglycan/xylan/chitin deacetylase (PgdA/CDA1 family)